jgi:hypothetical protein
VLPIVGGIQQTDGSLTSLFSSNIVSDLPEVQPRASIDLAVHLLRENGVTTVREVSVETYLNDFTVKSMVSALLKFLSIATWSIPSPSLVSTAAARLVKALKSFVDTEEVKYFHHKDGDFHNGTTHSSHSERDTTTVNTANPTPGGHSLKALIDLIKVEFDITAKPFEEVIHSALEYLSEEDQGKVSTATTWKEKAFIIAEVAGLITS